MHITAWTKQASSQVLTALCQNDRLEIDSLLLTFKTLTKHLQVQRLHQIPGHLHFQKWERVWASFGAVQAQLQCHISFVPLPTPQPRSRSKPWPQHISESIQHLGQDRLLDQVLYLLASKIKSHFIICGKTTSFVYRCVKWCHGRVLHDFRKGENAFK